MPSMEVQERPVFEVERSRTDTQTHGQKFFQTIYCNPPEGGGSTNGIKLYGFRKNRLNRSIMRIIINLVNIID